MSEQVQVPGNNQVDFFVGSIIDAGIKDDYDLMSYPFFALTKQPRTEPIVYDEGNIRIVVNPGNKGMATIWDKDILLYLVTVLNERIERGLPVERTIKFMAYDLLRWTGRSTGKSDYELLFDAMYRLRSTTIETSIETGGVTERRGFGWIDNFRIVTRETRRGTKVMAGLEITINEWMFRAIVSDRRVLTIDQGYFKLTQGLERRLYEIARKHVGHQEQWIIGLDKLRRRVGSQASLSEFKRQLNGIISRNRLPSYLIQLAYDPMKKETAAIPERHISNRRMLVYFYPRPNCRIGGPDYIGDEA